MADQEQELTPEREAQVRRLLAGAKAEEPTPPDVVRRLDLVLDGLAAEGAIQAPAGDPAVVALASRRRRRVASLLVAAAAVFVAATGINQVLGDSEAGDTPVTASDSVAVPEGTTQEAPDRTSAGSAGDSLKDFADADSFLVPSDSERGNTMELPQATAEVAPYAIRLGGGGLNEAAERVLRAAEGAPVGKSGYVDLTDVRLGRGLSRVEEFGCTPAGWGPGRLVPVLYKGTPNVLALREPEGNTQVVELLQCGTAEVVRSLTLTANADG